MLLGHKIRIASAYYRPSEENVTRYYKAIEFLTINEENRLKRKVETLEVGKNSISNVSRKS